MRKAQLSVFLIIGLFIIIAIGAVFFLITQSSDDPTRTTLSLNNEVEVREYIDQCIETSLSNGITLLAAQGGQILLVDDYFGSDINPISYAYNNQPTLASIADMEKHLEVFVEQQVSTCIEEIQSTGTAIDAPSPQSAIQITPHTVFATIDVNATVTSENIQTTINTIQTDLDSELGYLHEHLTEIVQQTEQNPDWIDLTLPQARDISTQVIPEKNHQVYSLTGKDGLTFLAAFYLTPNTPPSITVQDEFTVERNAAFTTQVQVQDTEGDQVVCEDNTGLFDISQECQISFTPVTSGIFDVLITASDGKEASSQSVRFIIS